MCVRLIELYCVGYLKFCKRWVLLEEIAKTLVFLDYFCSMGPCPVFYAFNFVADIMFSICVCAPDRAVLRRLFIFLQKMDIA